MFGFFKKADFYCCEVFALLSFLQKSFADFLKTFAFLISKRCFKFFFAKYLLHGFLKTRVFRMLCA
jgi:hypothetical protein